MSRRVPRTLRTLKLDYREIAALLLFPLAFPSLLLLLLLDARLRPPRGFVPRFFFDLLGASLRPPPSPSRVVPRVRLLSFASPRRNLSTYLVAFLAALRWIGLWKDGIVFVYIRKLRYVGISAPRACASERRRCVRVRRACLHHLRS